MFSVFLDRNWQNLAILHFLPGHILYLFIWNCWDLNLVIGLKLMTDSKYTPYKASLSG